ncbi:MAG: di-trans,poly-cis-decaprenylcistransferase [Leptospiraceae bacterium]|nr:di-trans,poly-cis-decaprenylcistransferase [Leptospiraceae bacterium]
MASLDPHKIPAHVAIILDGNGRWAKKRGLNRSEGHRAGGETLDRLLDFFIQLQVPVISLYAFSTENWKRPKAEVKAIWQLLNEFFKTRSGRAMETGIRIRASGDLEALPARSRQLIAKVMQMTADNQRLTANFCVNYGSRSEICQAASQIVAQRLALHARSPAKACLPVSESEIQAALYTHDLPDVDLLIRPGGEHRISNFLLWQCAYAEIYVTDTLWPDFSQTDIIEAVHWYQSRHRRFGGL